MDTQKQMLSACNRYAHNTALDFPVELRHDISTVARAAMLHGMKAALCMVQESGHTVERLRKEAFELANTFQNGETPKETVPAQTSPVEEPAAVPTLAPEQNAPKQEELPVIVLHPGSSSALKNPYRVRLKVQDHGGDIYGACFNERTGDFLRRQFSSNGYLIHDLFYRRSARDFWKDILANHEADGIVLRIFSEEQNFRSTGEDTGHLNQLQA